MKSIRSKVLDMERYLYELTRLIPQSGYVEVEDMIRLNRKIRSDIDSLYSVKPSDMEEKASFCAVLLQAYGVLYHDAKDNKQKQSLLDRSAKLLKEDLSPLSRCRLLVSCYGMVYEPDLAYEAHSIMEEWQGREQNAEELALIEMLRILEES